MVSRDYIPKHKMFEILDDIADMGVKSVTLSGGGEPFCYPFLLDVTQKLIEHKIKFASLTNGSLLKGVIAETFAHNATWLRISMDGWDDASYAKYRGVQQGIFSQIMSNIEAFKRINGSCLLGACIIVDKINATHIFDFTKKLKDAGVNSVKISPVIVNNSGAENNIYHRPIFDVVKEQTQKAVDELTDAAFDVFDSYHLLDNKFTKEYSWCPYLQILPVIGADLNIYPCQDKAYNLEEGLLGSIRDCRFKDFWFSDKNTFFKINPSRDCNHHCVANEKNTLILEYLNVDFNHCEFV